MKPFIVIAGPTAAGKTDTAVRLARLVGGEVISADSMQIYRYMDIGTAKPGAGERMGVPHFLIDELDPDEAYSAFEFKRRALLYADKIRKRGGYPIVCGGTGFYINALLGEESFDTHSPDGTYRDELYSIAREKGSRAVHDMLAAVDPVSAGAVHPNNIKRVVRALEYHKLTGERFSEHNMKMKSSAHREARIAILTMDRPDLYKRIDLRADKMISMGLRDEVEALLSRGYHPGLTSMQGLGYKEMVRHIQNECSLTDAAEAIKTGTRHFAKRQLTWFSRQCAGTWYNALDYSGPEALAGAIARSFGL